MLVASSTDEILRRKDFADMTAAELRRVRRLIAALPAAEPTRRSHRLQPGHAGDVLDMRRTLRAAMHTEGCRSGSPTGAASSFPGSWCSCATCPARWSRTPAR